MGSRPNQPAEVRIGDIALFPAERALAGPLGDARIEPRVAQVLLALHEASGVVPRDELFMRCWGTLAAGDDSLNRSIYQLRKALAEVGSAIVNVETVAAMGYLLKVTEAPLPTICEAARRSWRMGLPRPDDGVIRGLQSSLANQASESSEAWGLLALHLCRAAEYAPIEQCADIVHRCEEAAQAALSLDPTQPDARVALSSLSPLYGDWLGSRTRLLAVLADSPEHFPARHELAVLEMSTGRVSAAVPLIAGLMEEDPLAATLHYKRGYHLYCLGQFDAMDRVLDNALQLWPGHPGLWQCRTMTLAFTGRAAAALALLDDEGLRPPMPPATLDFHRWALTALADGGPRIARETAEVLSDAAGWQTMAVAAIMYLSALGEAEQALAVCERYYLRDGEKLVRLRYEPGIETSINEMHRRATQPLFLPVTAPLREHPRFLRLCERMGLVDYWDYSGVRPDFLVQVQPATPQCSGWDATKF